MRIRNRLVQLQAAAVSVVNFIKRHKRASIAVAVALLIAGPLLTGIGGETFCLNPVSSTGQALVGLGVIALVVRRIVGARERKQARQANCRCHCHRNQRRQQQTATQQQQGGTP